MTISGNTGLALDREGYLCDLDDWSEDVAIVMASNEGITLLKQHWEIIHLLRAYYRRHRVSLANRALVKLVERELGKDKGRSLYLMRLFGGSPAKTVSKIAGLPKPDNCL